MSKFKIGDRLAWKSPYEATAIATVVDIKPHFHPSHNYYVLDEDNYVDEWYDDFIDNNCYVIYNYNSIWRNLNGS
jgi:hypothetical protein